MGHKIIIVDDSRITRSVLKKTLDIAGVETEALFEAENGQLGLDILGEHKDIDLILADINMPVMNGIEMIEKIYEDETIKHIPIVLITTEAGKSRIDHLMQLGVKSYIHKPFIPETVKEIVDNVIGGAS